MGCVPPFPREDCAAASPRAARTDPGAARFGWRASAAAPPRLPIVSVLALCAVALLLEGCGKTRKCKITDVYGLLQVDGSTGHSKVQLDAKGVRLCARHIGKKDTYKDPDLCSHPDEVFPSGELPDVESADGQALLLVRCPSVSYPRGRDMQRVTCGSSGSFYYDDGDDAKMMFLFDSTRHPINCQTEGPTKGAHQEALAHAPPRRPAGPLPGAHPARARVGAKPVQHGVPGGDPLLSPAGSWEGLAGETDAGPAADRTDDDDDGPAAGAEREIVLAAGAAGAAAVLVQPSGDVLPGPPLAGAARPPGGRGRLQAPEASLLEMPSRPESAKDARLLESANGSAQRRFSEEDLLARLERTRLLLESR